MIRIWFFSRDPFKLTLFFYDKRFPVFSTYFSFNILKILLTKKMVVSWSPSGLGKMGEMIHEEKSKRGSKGGKKERREEEKGEGERARVINISFS